MTFLTVNAVVAETHDEAMALLLPNLQMMGRLRTGQPLGCARSRRGRRTDRQLSPQAQRGGGVAGCGEPSSATPTEAADQVRALADEFGVDEVMVNPVASARRGTDPGDRARTRQDAGAARQRALLASVGRTSGRQPDDRDRPRWSASGTPM